MRPTPDPGPAPSATRLSQRRTGGTTNIRRIPVIDILDIACKGTVIITLESTQPVWS